MILVIGGGPAGWLSGVGGPPEVEGYAIGQRADWTPIGALTSCFLLTHRGQHRALNNSHHRQAAGQHRPTFSNPGGASMGALA